MSPSMKKLKEEEEDESRTMENPPDQNQLSEEEENIKMMNKAMDKVFAIPLVVEEILDYLELKDLHTCRFVCSMLKDAATKIMFKRDYFQVIIQYDDDMKKYRKVCVEKEKIQKSDHLTELTKIIESSILFPSSDFWIYGNNLGDPDMMDFFEVAGEGIKSLRFNWIDRTSLKDFRQILEVHCPNVESLEIHNGKFSWSEDIQFVLPNLKILSMGKPAGSCVRFEILRTIIAPNLQVIQDFNLQRGTMEVVKAGKIHIMKELDLPWSWICPANHFQAFVSGGPRLEVLKLPPFHPKYNEMYMDKNWRINFPSLLHQLLDISKDTLKLFEFSGLGSLFEKLKLPQFSNLKEMKIHDPFHHPSRIFPIRINLGETFPHLQVLDVSALKLRDDENWNKYFPLLDAFRGQLISVTKLRVVQGFSEDSMMKLRLMCPNATVCGK